MKTDNITSAKQKADQSIELTITDPFNGTSSKKRYAAIRGGISWPTAKAPAYFCVVAQEYVAPDAFGDESPPGSRVLLAEHESKTLSLSKFFSRIIDTAEQMFCRSFYVEMPEDRLDCGYLNDFDDFSSEQKSDIILCDAYDVENFVLGVSRIKEGTDKGALLIPEDSIVFTQLRSLTRTDLETSPEEIFFAINALRHVFGSYHRCLPTNRTYHPIGPPPNPYVI